MQRLHGVPRWGAVQEPEWFVGRIVCDSEGHLNASSALLEGTLQHSQGHSVRLDLSQLPSYRLFPGQVRWDSPLNYLKMPQSHRRSIESL